MKILHLLYESSGDSFGIGGVGMRAYEIYRRLKERHEVTLLCKKYPGARNGEQEGLSHLFAGSETRSFLKALLSYAIGAARFVRAHAAEYDIVIEEFSPAIPTFLHAVTSTPLVLQVQGYTGGLYFRKYNLLYALVLYALERVRPRHYGALIFISEETKMKYSTAGTRQVAVIPNGIPPELLNTDPEEGDYILYLGRIDTYGKGLDLLLKAYAQFRKEFPEIRLVIAGEGRDQQSFMSRLMTLPQEVRDTIELAGWVSGGRKGEVLRRALFCVFPSRHEVQPIAVLEAMACGKAVVVSSIPEFGFIASGRAGVVFESGSVSSLTEAMGNLAKSSERGVMGQRGRDMVKDHTWDTIALRYEAFLLEVLGTRNMKRF